VEKDFNSFEVAGPRLPTPAVVFAETEWTGRRPAADVPPDRIQGAIPRTPIREFVRVRSS